jgi:hypothetical protein
LLDTAGQVDRFMKRLKASQDQQAEAAKRIEKEEITPSFGWVDAVAHDALPRFIFVSPNDKTPSRVDWLIIHTRGVVISTYTNPEKCTANIITTSNEPQIAIRRKSCAIT